MADLWEYGWLTVGGSSKHYFDATTNKQTSVNGTYQVAFHDSSGRRQMGPADQESATDGFIEALNELGGQCWEAVSSQESIDINDQYSDDEEGSPFLGSRTRLRCLLKRQR